MQRRAIRDAKTPEKMKQVKPVVDDSLTLQGKKDKIKSNLQRLAELGKVDPQNRYQDLINDIAKVRTRGAALCRRIRKRSPLHLLYNWTVVFACCRTSETRGGTASVGKPSWCACSRPTPPSTPRPLSSTIRSTRTTSTSRRAWTTWPARASE